MAGTGDAAAECGSSNTLALLPEGRGGKLKYLLPLVQMALAALLWQSYQWDELNRPSRYNDSPGIGPARILLVCVDGPPLLLIALSSRPLGFGYWMFLGYGFRGLDAVFVVCIGVFWYWISLNILSLRNQNRLVLFTWLPLRIAVDLLLMALSPLMFGFKHLDIAGMPWPWLIPSLTLFLIWASWPLIVFGCDLLRVARASFEHRTGK